MTRLALKRSAREFEYTGDRNNNKKQKRADVEDRIGEMEVEESIKEIEKRRKKEGEIKGAEEKKRYDKKTISDWMKKEWTRRKEAANICSGRN